MKQLTNLNKSTVIKNNLFKRCCYSFLLFCFFSNLDAAAFQDVSNLDSSVILTSAEEAKRAYLYTDQDTEYQHMVGANHITYFITGRTGHEAMANEHVLGIVRRSNPDGADMTNRVYIAYHGSKYLDDWFSDFAATFRSAPYGLPGFVHKGFYDSAESSWAHLDSILRNSIINVDQTEFIITGHSFGGALATLSAVHLQQNFGTIFQVEGLQPEKNQIKIITFSAPRVGDATFVNRFDQYFRDSMLRFICKGDIVPKTPFWLKHSGRQIDVYLGDNVKDRAEQIIYDFRPKNLDQAGKAGYKLLKYVKLVRRAIKKSSSVILEGAFELIITAHNVPSGDALENAYYHFKIALATADSTEAIEYAGSPTYCSERNPIRKYLGL